MAAGTITEKAISEERCGDDDAADLDVGNGAEEESAVMRLGQSFGELTEGLPGVAFNVWPGPFAGGMPGTLEIAETLTMSLMRIDQRLGFVRDELGRTRFDFDWVGDDCRAGQRAALGELKEVEETLGEIRSALLCWLGTVHSNSTRIIEVSRDAWPLLHELASLSPLHHRAQATGCLVEIALEYLAASDDARRIVADAEARRSAKRHGLAEVVNDGGGTSSGSAKAEQLSGLADSGDSAREDSAADVEPAARELTANESGDADGDRGKAVQEQPEAKGDTLAFSGDIQDPIYRVQLWRANETSVCTDCICDLCVLFADPGPVAEDRLLGRLGQIVAEETLGYAKVLAEEAGAKVSGHANNGGSTKVVSASAEPHEQSAQAR
ncbi:MAG TPA: hypothetical protein VM487_22680 [Phycisphaerae bacterium]|nr:hypothetical protein [Phycisphaerae bacterium]